MLRKKSLLRVLAIALVLSMQLCMLSGCGDKENDNGKAATEEVTPTPAPEAAQDETTVASDDATDADNQAEAEEAVEEEPQGPTAKDMWEGTWFGCLNFGDCTGKFTKSSGGAYANYLVLNFDDDNSGKFTISNSWEQYGSGDFEIVDDHLRMTGGTVFDSPLNTDNWKFENMDSYGRKIIMEDLITDVDGDNLQYFIWLKPWGSDWSEMNQTALYNDIFKPYEDRLSAGQNPPYGFVNEFISSGEADFTTATSGGSDKKADAKDDADKKDTSAKDDSDNAGGSEGLDIPAVDPNNYVIVDNDSVKIVCKGTGVDKYNSSWIGYILEITNKTKDSIFFNARSAFLDGNSVGGGDTCFYNGKKNKTHFEMVMNPEIADYEMTLAIDGVTDVSQVKDVSGYIYVSNDTTHEEIGYFPYHFK